MGSGWPNDLDRLQVVIGDRFNPKPSVAFSEDDVITLQRAETTATFVRFTEDGTTDYDWKTNRIMFSIKKGTGSVTLYVSVRTYQDVENFSTGVIFPVAYYPYDFKDAFTNNVAFTSYADSDYFSSPNGSGMSPAMEYNGGIFKAMTFIAN